MSMSEEEQRAIMEAPPKGTFVILFIISMIMLAGWLALYFIRFLGHGPVS
jgi:hypothetical protein